VTKGMSLQISNLSFKLRDDGTMEGPDLKLHVRFDACPTWVQIAKRHLESALQAEQHRNAVWTGTDENAKGTALQEEFEASMQAIAAAAIAWDALYAVLVDLISLPVALRQKWRRGRTPRYSQVAEVIRMAFTLKPKSVLVLRKNLRAVFRFRDLAVHPSGKLVAPSLHPDLDVGMDPKFVSFRAANANAAVSVTAVMLWELSHKNKPRNPKVKEYSATLAGALEQIYPSGPTVPPQGTASAQPSGTAAA
jgi:hypothetical protein